MHNLVHKCWVINDNKSNLRLDFQYCERTKVPVSGAARSKAARLLGLWVRIQPGAWMCVCCECCVFSGRGLCVGLIIRTEEPYRVWCV